MSNRSPLRFCFLDHRALVSLVLEVGTVSSLGHEKGLEEQVSEPFKKVGRRSPHARSRIPTFGARPLGGKLSAPRRHSRRHVLVAVS